MNRIFNRVILAVPPAATLAFVAWTYLFGASAAAKSATSLRPGDPVPELRLHGADGSTPALAALTAGSGGVVVVVDPRCELCHTELEALRGITSSGAPARPLVVVSTGDEKGAAELRARYAPLALYDDAEDGLARRYGLQSVPLLLVVGPRGKVVEVRAGLQAEATLRRLLASSGAP